MTEKEIQLLGFQKENMEEYDGDDDYYYTLDIANGLTFITPAASELKNGEWFVEIFNIDPLIRFEKFENTQSLINKLTKAIVKK